MDHSVMQLTLTLQITQLELSNCISPVLFNLYHPELSTMVAHHTAYDHCAI